MTRSLQFRLSAWISMLIAGIAAMAGVIAFQTAFHEANELQDDQLKQIAALITLRSLAVMEREALGYVPGADRESRLVVQTLNDPVMPLALPADLPDGIQNVSVDRETWRIFVKTLNASTRVVVGQATAARDEIARNSALATIMPFVALMPVLLLVIGFLVRRVFRPLTSLSSGLDHRSDQDLSELPDASLPAEIVPFVVAINRLLVRVGQSVALQRRFVADAAHELRSPLTALSLQAERLEATDMSAQALERLTTLRRGLARTGAQLDQLLTFARVQDGNNTHATDVSIQRVLRVVLEDLMPLAQAKRIDLGVTSTGDATVRASDVDLRMLVKNLVDNAIRYTPERGRIDLSIHERDGIVQLRVADTGPGIPAAERERVFDPFYRILGNEQIGSGLGLSIVQTIAKRIGACVELGDVIPRGLRVTVTFMP
jgi:two-component system OmpR family sensor kinase